jgi:hypothetical protein
MYNLKLLTNSRMVRVHKRFASHENGGIFIRLLHVVLASSLVYVSLLTHPDETNVSVGGWCADLSAPGCESLSRESAFALI